MMKIDINFINKGTDELICKSLGVDIKPSVQIDIKKSREGLVQVMRMVQGRTKTFPRLYWVRPDEVRDTDRVINNDTKDFKKKKKRQITDYKSTDTDDADKMFKSETIKKLVPGDLLCQHIDENGKLSKEREKLHKSIIRKHLKGVKKPPEGLKPVFTLLGGGPASGKSTFTDNPENGFTDKSTFVKVDSDGIKAMLPEYKQLNDEGNMEAAAYAHEESSALAKRTVAVASNAGYNVMLDGTGDGSLKGLLKKIKQAKANGMRVDGVYCTVSIEEAISRSDKRAEKTGRFVPHSKIAKTHIEVSKILPQAVAEMDTCRLYDTSTKEAKLIATGGNGKPLTAEPGMEKALEEFLNKGTLNAGDYE